ncbi:MAG: isoleucine--tRNA ligase [Xanthomonadaceae bacterium]|nr:isoleucine--tRNA ligase [Rhodospirillaceae bacterium]NIA17854.1 isoleucine--tRNA ligase [Xanthomonadaceae bacterium]
MSEIKKGNFSQQEEEILKFWKENKIFEKSLKKEAPKGDYVFYDGPPFATGLPHYGHIVASIIKDVVPRYQTMKGYHVERKWGWDCHGLPIENIVEKEFGSQSKKDIEKMGVEKFNKICRSKVLNYVKDWEKTIKRLGRFVDMKNSYKTMDLDFMESVWWVFKELWDKGLIYKGYKPMHICPRCETTLSQSEVAEGYKNIKDLSATVKFKLKAGQKIGDFVVDDNTYILAWTTTPWTLIGNVALAINKSIKYQVLSIKGKPEKYILAKNRVKDVLKDKEYKIIIDIEGKGLVGLKYKPVFDYYSKDKNLENKENAWKIYHGDFVTTDEGTGVVHIAPAFGEDDMNLGEKYNLPFIQHVKMDGVIKKECKDFAGMNVKPIGDHQKTDVEIIKYLAHKNLLFAKEKFEHSYPHCWRCDTPLINYATSSWFVNITKIKKLMLELAKKINWSPTYLKEGRFGHWLENARDWSISRQRFWAAVIPIWICDKCGEKKVIGSIKELEKLSKQRINDLHKDIVDKVVFKCEKCGGTMRRVPDVLDCWFESGAMPYAQMHYPFENKEKFERNFPAEFIAEGIDQTRAWFYYLHAIAVGIKNSPAYKNVIVNGIVLAEDGKKMSKKLKNYPDPFLVLDKYGADALRYYLLTSPVMLAENLNFSEKGVDEVLKKVLMILKNVLNFYKLFAPPLRAKRSNSGNIPQIAGVTLFPPRADIRNDTGKNILDKWILIKLNLLIKEIEENMDAYNLVKASRPIAEFINDLSTWYLRRSRERFKGDERKDKQDALQTTRYVLLTLAKLIAPFMPFMAEYLYKEVGGEKESVHLEEWPTKLKVKSKKSKVIENMEMARKIVELGLAKRAEAGIKIRQPLRELKVKSQKVKVGKEYLNLIKDEINVKNVKIVKGNENMKVELDTKITPELKQEGLKREIVRAINSLRKNGGLTIKDRVNLYWKSENKEIKKIFEKYKNDILKDTLALDILDNLKSEINCKEIKIDNEILLIKIEKI